MEKTEKKRHEFGLVGRNIAYSFSRGYFASKFETLGLDDHSYVNFDIPTIDAFSNIIATTKDLKGLNVTIPYKEEVIPFLDDMDTAAREIGAVNTIKLDGKKLKGYNTDAYGFQKSLEPHLCDHHKKALILGTGGASKAVAYVLHNLGLDHLFVSRRMTGKNITYEALEEDILKSYTLIINCTPLGTYPNVTAKPDIPYHFIGKRHLLFDLIYNPEKTSFLKAGEEQGATILNGLKMLELQAEKAWSIWNG